MSATPARLSCEQCARRKTKCSKTSPCSACEKAGIQCTAVQRQRLPRGKSGKQKTDTTSRRALRDRVEQLESLVTELQHAKRHKPDLPEKERGLQELAASSDADKTPLQAFVASDFWTELSSAVTGLREVLENTDDFEDASESIGDHFPHEAHHKLDTFHGSYGPDRLLFGDSYSADTALNLSPVLKERLLNVYKERVDCLFKPLHWPATLSIIRQQGVSYEGSKQKAETHALEYALYFTSACTLFDYELDHRQSIVEELRRECECALVHAGLLTTTSFMLLQALVVYLAGIRACRSNAQQWTLTAIAVRLANAQGIPSSLTAGDVSADLEVRRRVWQCIGVLDLQSAFDRGSQPLIASRDLQSLPTNTNDYELNSDIVPPAACVMHYRWTDMSLSTIIYQAGSCQRRLTEVGLSVTSNQGDHTAAHREQLDMLAGFRNHAHQLTKACGSSPSDVQRFAMAVAQESLVAMHLLIYRPLHRRGHAFVPVDENFNILHAATEVLERSQMKRTQFEFAPWAWFQWVKWYALAVVLAELCGTLRGPLTDRAWKVAQGSFENYAKDVADTKSGLLWTPIQKLMRKVRQDRKLEAPHVPSATASSTNEHFFGNGDVSIHVNGEEEHIDHSQRPIHSNIGLSSRSYNEDENNSLVDEGKTSADSWIYWDLLLSDLNNPIPPDWQTEPSYAAPTT